MAICTFSSRMREPLTPPCSHSITLSSWSSCWLCRRRSSASLCCFGLAERKELTEDLAIGTARAPLELLRLAALELGRRDPRRRRRRRAGGGRIPCGSSTLRCVGGTRSIPPRTRSSSSSSSAPPSARGRPASSSRASSTRSLPSSFSPSPSAAAAAAARVRRGGRRSCCCGGLLDASGPISEGNRDLSRLSLEIVEA